MLVFDIINIKDKSFVKYFFRVNQFLFALINEDIYNLIIKIMIKQLRFLLLTIWLSTFMSAAAFTVDGISYKVLSSIDKTVEVTSGNYSGDIVIPEKVTDSGIEYTVTKIGNSAFYYCYTIKSISLPNTITEIGESAFEYCVYLTNLT